MKHRDDRVYLRHILDAIAQIEEYTQGISKNDFPSNRLIQDGTVRELEIIGEASRNLSEEFRAEHSAVPWPEIIAMRNRIVHAYFELDLDAVWDAVKLDLPCLKAQVEAILQRP